MTGLVKGLTHPRVIPVDMNQALNKLLTKSLFVLLSGMLATPLFVLNILAPDSSNSPHSLATSCTPGPEMKRRGL